MNQNNMAVGIDLGGTKTRIGVVNASGKVIEEFSIPTNIAAGANSIIATLINEISNLKLRFNLSAVGIAVAGQVDANTGTIKFGPNLHWHNVPIAQKLFESLKLPIFVANDVRAATFGEWHFGAANGMQNFICLFIGTGIGGGIVTNGALMTGCNNSAGEVGHMVINNQGELCTCGNRGCWETQAAGWGIAKLTQKAVLNGPDRGLRILSLANGDAQQINARHLFQAAIDKDPLAIELVEGIEKALIAGATSIVNIFNPECLVFGGGIIEGAPWLIERIDKGVRAQALKSATEKLQILPAQNLKDAAVIGISAMAREAKIP